MNWSGLSLWAGTVMLALATSLAVQASEPGASWSSLSPAQQQVLAPLQREWATIDAGRREKWIEVASKFPTMPADERARVQARMSDWARMTPAQRAAARQQFQEVKQLPAEERQERWNAYQALSPEERGQLAQRAKPAARVARAASAAQPRGTTDADTRKRNIVGAPAAAPGRVVAPTVVQARPGATTTTMTTRATPPLHNQAGLPKIAATPGFVDPATLLPQRGPQGAAVRAAPPAEPPRHQ